MSQKKVALVIGAGSSLGSAIARVFASDNYTTVVARRNGDELGPLKEEIESKGGECLSFSLDARKEEDVINFIEMIENEIGEINVAVYNIGANIRFNILETTSRKYYKVWEMAAFGAFLMGREVARKMLPRKKGTIIFTGATASVRGKEGFAAFSGAKQAKRALAQSMAKELAPKGIHVAHIIVDGAIDTPWVNKLFPEYVKEKKKIDGLMKPDDIAQNYLVLHNQPKNAWTFELDLRPWVETW
jgi:NAD(P)-dependent dehydrogenase (short-subunit alcohol dehydrogenase family)